MSYTLVLRRSFPVTLTCRLPGVSEKSLRHRVLEDRAPLHWTTPAIPICNSAGTLQLQLHICLQYQQLLRHQSCGPWKTFCELIRFLMKSVPQLHMNILWRLTLRYVSACSDSHLGCHILSAWATELPLLMSSWFVQERAGSGTRLCYCLLQKPFQSSPPSCLAVCDHTHSNSKSYSSLYKTLAVMFLFVLRTWPKNCVAATDHVSRASGVPLMTWQCSESMYLKNIQRLWILQPCGIWGRNVPFALRVQAVITWAKAALGLQSTEHAVGQLWSTQKELVRQIFVNWTIQCTLTLFIFWVSPNGLFWIQLHCLLFTGYDVYFSWRKTINILWKQLKNKVWKITGKSQNELFLP